MRTVEVIIAGQLHEAWEAAPGMVFRRLIDGLEMGSQIIPGIDWSTGTPRPDKLEYYEEIEPEILILPSEEEKGEALKIVGIEL